MTIYKHVLEKQVTGQIITHGKDKVFGHGIVKIVPVAHNLIAKSRRAM